MSALVRSETLVGVPDADGRTLRIDRSILERWQVSWRCARQSAHDAQRVNHRRFGQRLIDPRNERRDGQRLLENRLPRTTGVREGQRRRNYVSDMLTTVIRVEKTTPAQDKTLCSLELGGAPQDLANLWPELWNGDANAHMKDAVEIFLNREVCRGAMPLAEAQRQIVTDWLAVYRSHGLSPAP
jgi:hypothetical protein